MGKRALKIRALNLSVRFDPILVDDLVDLALLAFLDIRIEIDALAIQQHGEMTRDTGFPNTHESRQGYAGSVIRKQQHH